MHALTTLEFLTRLATGVACGALIGVERQWRAQRGPSEFVSVRAIVTVSGDIAQALEPVIARLSLEPGIHDLHWHLDEDDPVREPVPG